MHGFAGTCLGNRMDGTCICRAPIFVLLTMLSQHCPIDGVGVVQQLLCLGLRTPGFGGSG